MEIAERNAIDAEARVAECDDEVTALLDLKLEARAAGEMQATADALVRQ